MAKSINKAILLGNIGRDAETKDTTSGTRTSFSLATTRSYKSNGEWKEETEWHNITAFNKEKLAPYLTKGTRIYVEGEIRTREYEDSNTGEKKRFTNIIAQDIVLCGGGAKDGGGGRREGAEPAGGEAWEDEDVPF